MIFEKKDVDNIDERKLKRLKLRLIELEKENIVTKKRKKDEMIDEIRKIIEDEVRRCY